MKLKDKENQRGNCNAKLFENTCFKIEPQKVKEWIHQNFQDMVLPSNFHSKQANKWTGNTGGLILNFFIAILN
jgi:hypothetical protein